VARANVRFGSWAEARARPDPGGFAPESGLPTNCPELPALGPVERLLLAQTCPLLGGTCMGLLVVKHGFQQQHLSLLSFCSCPEPHPFVPTLRSDSSSSQPAGQPEAIPARLKGEHNPFDRATGLDPLVSPSQQQSQQRVRIGPQLLQWLPAQMRNETSCQPAAETQFYNGHQSARMIEGDEGLA
jgi:hypothetical protein